jgi:hypothetical protein
MTNPSQIELIRNNVGRSPRPLDLLVIFCGDTMRIKHWVTKDIFFNEPEREKVTKHIDRLKKSGWDVVVEDDASGVDEFEYCTQLNKLVRKI